MKEETRLCIGGPFDKKFVKIKVNLFENSRTIYQLVGIESDEIERYYPYDVFYNGIQTQIVLRHESILEENLWSHVLEGYSQNCLHID